MSEDNYMMKPWNLAKLNRHFQIVSNLLTNYIVLIIKFIPAFCVLDISR